MLVWRNDYPNGENYPTPSFSVPVTPPDVDPDEGELISVAFNPAYVPIIEGCLDQLMLPSTYEGTEAEIQLALNRAANLRDLLQNDISEVPPPYWDTPENSDDELPPETQVWYGNWIEGEFVENIGTWIIAGFVAYAATPAAAIAFLTIAPRFRLAFKTGDVGGIIRAFIDGADSGTIDTFSAEPGIIEQDFIGEPDLDEHEIILVLEE